MAITKSTELANTGKYPANRLNERERKTLTVAESYSPSVAANWAVAPTTQDAALNALAANNAGGRAFTVSALYDFSVQGGAIGTVSLGVSLPIKAIVLEVVSDVVTAPTSSGSTGTIALAVPTEGVLNTALAANGSASTTVPVYHSPNSASPALPKKCAAARNLSVTIATAAVTAGKIRYIVRYVLGD
jgi:hypothetical protein